MHFNQGSGRPPRRPRIATGARSCGSTWSTSCGCTAGTA